MAIACQMCPNADCRQKPNNPQRQIDFASQWHKSRASKNARRFYANQPHLPSSEGLCLPKQGFCCILQLAMAKHKCLPGLFHSHRHTKARLGTREGLNLRPCSHVWAPACRQAPGISCTAQLCSKPIRLIIIVPSLPVRDSRLGFCPPTTGQWDALWPIHNPTHIMWEINKWFIINHNKQVQWSTALYLRTVHTFKFPGFVQPSWLSPGIK